jgi:hypothetical protein
MQCLVQDNYEGLMRLRKIDAITPTTVLTGGWTHRRLASYLFYGGANIGGTTYVQDRLHQPHHTVPRRFPHKEEIDGWFVSARKVVGHPPKTYLTTSSRSNHQQSVTGVMANLIMARGVSGCFGTSVKDIEQD